jgi:hypothetical protein
MIAINSFCSL